MYWSGELFMRSRKWYFDVYLTRDINTKITLEWVHKQFVPRVHGLICFLYDKTNPWITIKKTIFTHRPQCLPRSVSVLLMTSQSIADDVIMSRQLWREYVKRDNYSFDMDFIHANIHSRSWKNYRSSPTPTICTAYFFFFQITTTWFLRRPPQYNLMATFKILMTITIWHTSVAPGPQKCTPIR